MRLLTAQQCSAITKPTNGEVNTTAGSGTEYASVLMFSCDPGYDLVGSVYIHCKSDGNWSHPVPTCQSKKVKKHSFFQNTVN